MEICFVLYLGSLGYLGLGGLAAAGPVFDAGGNRAHRNATTNGLADVFRKRVQILKEREQVELVILADGSHSVGPRNFFSELKFIQKVISDVEVSAEAFRLGIIIYSTGAVVHVDHLSATEPADLEKCSLLNFDIPGVKYPGMNTNTKEALEKAEKIFTRGRRGASRVVFLLTDGFSNMGNPIPAANILKEQGVEIFTFGIKNGNVKELEAVASRPVDEHTYLFASFAEFEGFARRALHEDLAPGRYAPAKNSSFCDHLCPHPGKQGCCAADAVCACGLISGHFACLCPPGHYGSGFIGEGCTLCPPGTYSEGRVPGDALTCTPCPDVHHVIVRYPATSKAHCVCQNGTEPEGDSCKIVSCPKLSPPANGYFVKKQCSNVINAACGARCHLGYVLTGSSVRLCQRNGTWSGHAPVCRPKNCRVPGPVPGSQVACSSDDERSSETTSDHQEGRGGYSLNGTEFEGTIGGGEYPVGTICAYSCSPGHFLVGSKSRACLPMLKWSGLRPMCKSIKCASLPDLTKGSVKPKNCTKQGAVHAFGSVCRFQCDPGYELKGSKLSNCTGKHGTWTERGAARRCVDVEPPSIDCPANFSVKTDGDLHFATIKLKLPETNDNSGVKPVVWSKPAFDEDHPLRLIIGETRIEVYSVDGTGNHAYCSFTVNVKDEEKPKVLECRSPRVFFVSEFPPDSSGISWEEPVFDDNSGIPITVTREPRKLSLAQGTTAVTYKAVDAAGNAAFCSINVTILDDPCSERPEDGNSMWNCSSDPGKNLTTCTVSCPEGFAFAEEGVLALETTCTYTGRKAHWSPDLFSGDVDLFPECSEVTEPEEMPNEIIIEGSSAELCDHLDAFSDELTNDVTSGDVDFIITSFCEDVDPEDMIIPMRGNETRKDEFLTTFSPTHGESEADPEKGGTETGFTRPIACSTDSTRAGAECEVGHGTDEAQRFDSTAAATPYESFTSAHNLVDEIATSGTASGTASGTVSRNYEVTSNGYRTVELSQTRESSADDPNEVEADRRKRSAGRSGKRLRIRISPKGAGNGAEMASFKETLDLIGKHLDERVGDGFRVGVGQHTIGKSRVCRQGSLPRHGVCVKCPKGTFHDGVTSRCVPCPVGHYQEAEGEIRCDPCPEGYSTRKMRRKQAKQCKRICPPGTYGRRPSDTGVALAPCRPCPTGSYQNQRGQTSCEACPNDLTTLRSGAETPLFCLADHRASDSCVSVTCHNGGQCQTHEGFPRCKCAPGFVGSFCERKYDPCGSEPCYNGGSCEASGPESYVCRCLSGFEGADCKKEVDECSPDPCNGRGTCTDLLNAFKCDCAPGYVGLACEEKLHRICEELEPCANGGTCAEIDDDSYACSCPQGYSGRHCDVFYDCPSDDCSLSDSTPPYTCSDVDCGSRMRCSVGRTRKPECICADGFRGNNCTEEVDGNVVLTFPRHAVTEYLMVDFPDGHFNEISVCTWIETKDTFNYGTLFSYSTPEEDNAFTLTDYSGLVLYVSGKHVVTDLEANDGFWHFVCVTWESGEGRWEVYLDGSLYSHGAGLSEGVRLRGGGKLVVGQEQDTFGGGFNDVESFAGRITYFDVWDHVLLPSRIDDLFRECDTAFGNLIPWPSFLQRIHGDVVEKKSQFCQSCSSSLQIYRGRIIYGYVGGGKVATYQCDEGFVIKFDSDDQPTVDRGQFYHRKCMKFGGWHVQEPKCKRISCGFPGYFPRGQIFGRSYRYGDEIVYKCSEGYRLEGNDTRICLASGTWSGKAPICRGQSTECKKLVAPRHGSMFVFFGGDRSYSTATLAAGDRVEFTCDKGYIITGFGVLTCTEGGVWDRRPPTCRRVECPVPIEYAPSLSAADRESKTYHFGDALAVPCSGGRVRLMVCGELGTWDSDESRCRTACQKPLPAIENGFVVGEESDGPHFEGETLGVSCYPGFERRGDDVLTCSADGRWIQSRPTLCRRLACGPPPRPPPSYRIVHAEGHGFGDRIFLRCNPGYESPGKIVIHCQANGKYSRVQNHCTRIHCEKDDLPNGYEAHVEGSRHPYGTRIQVECPSSRSPSLRVRGHVVCGADGLWSSVPECLGHLKEHRDGGNISSP